MDASPWPALYHHFPSKGALLDGVAEAMFEAMAPPSRADIADPMERIRAGLRRYRRAAIDHPQAFVLLTTRRAATPRAMAVFERVLEPFAELGVDDATMARLFRLGGYFVGGAGHAEIASRAKAPDATPVVMESLETPACPLLTRVAPHLRLSELDAVFEFRLEVVMRAVAESAKVQREATKRRGG